MGMKRGRESRNLAKKAAKKQRVEENTGQDGEDIVGLDDLDWQTVQLPDRLGDVGGFFGLEEIDGVDIVRPESTGQIKFKVTYKWKVDRRRQLSNHVVFYRSHQINRRNQYSRKPNPQTRHRARTMKNGQALARVRNKKESHRRSRNRRNQNSRTRKNPRKRVRRMIRSQ